MGIDCSNCKCTNQDDEKILVIDNSNVIKNERRKDFIEKSQSSNKPSSEVQSLQVNLYLID